MNNPPYRNARSGKVFAGLLLIILGCVFMLDRLGANLPHWVISWPMFLIALGLYLGAKNQFRKPGAVILIAIGSLFLADDIIPNMNFSDFIWPIILICVGGFLIMGRNKKGWKEQWRQSAEDFRWDKSMPAADPGSTDPSTGPDPVNPSSSRYAGEDFIDSVAIFGGVKKNITSKNFRGGEIVNFMGGAEINLTQADFTGIITLDVTQVFGGTKIIVPPHWQIHSEMSAIFGGVEDRRPVHIDSVSQDKKLIIKGTSIFGGIDIRSY